MSSFLVAAQPAAADTLQSFACFSPLTSTYSTIPLPLSGNGSPDPIEPGQNTTFSGLAATFVVAPFLAVAGIGAGALDFVTNPALLGSVDPLSGGDGVNSASNTTTARFTASNTTTAGSVTTTGAVTARFFLVFDGANASSLVIYSETAPNSWDGSGTDGLVIVPQIPIVIPLTPSITVTGNGTEDDITLAAATGPLPANPAGAPTTPERNAAPVVLLNNLGIQANFFCWPGASTGPIDPLTGLPGATAGFAPAPAANAIDTVSVQVIPAEAPVANNDTATVGGGQSVNIPVLTNDTDVNNNIDPTSVAIVSNAAGGTAVANADGTVTYTNTNAAIGTDTFTYTVDDLGGLTSNVATVSVSVLGNQCTASPSCSLSQVIEVDVNGAALTMEQSGTNVTLAPITLNGQPQSTGGNLNGLTVVNRRGTDAAWNVTGQVTDFSDGTGVDTCPANNPASWDNHCIPGDNLGWTPSASVAHTVIPGDVAQVNAGSAVANGMTNGGTGLGTAGGAKLLCGAPLKHSGGTFACGAGVSLAIPASAAAGTYEGTLTLTIL